MVIWYQSLNRSPLNFIMKFILVVVLALVAIAAAAPVDETPKIVAQNFESNPDGGYQSNFETENGIKQTETGLLKTVTDEENVPHSVVVVKGSYTYTDEKGTPVVVTYEADENGFRAEGDVIPKNQS